MCTISKRYIFSTYFSVCMPLSCEHHSPSHRHIFAQVLYACLWPLSPESNPTKRTQEIGTSLLLLFIILDFFQNMSKTEIQVNFIDVEFDELDFRLHLQLLLRQQDAG